MNKFKIVTPAYNCEKWMEKTIKSIAKQTYENFDCLIIDDMSTDKTAEIALKHIGGDERFSLQVNKEKKYALRNFYEGFQTISNDKEDILITMDGDDWLSDETVLQKVDDVYNKTNCLITYGSFIEYPSGITHKYYLYPYDNYVIENNLFRNVPWKASQLRTFKRKLWDKIKISDLIDTETGDFYHVTCDLAMMFPMMEMAGNRSQHIGDLIYVYNKQNPLSDMYVREREQLLKASQIRKKQKYLKENF